jgi:3-deoxy-D-manno-octulosonic-acid transferase
LAARLISPWNSKARLWLKGRKSIFQKIRKNYQPNGKHNIWMHCASLGEFEQGRPVIKKLKQAYPELQIVITFFSSSGYEIAIKNKEFEQVYYLPIDNPSNARKLLSILNPDLILWVKYEYWYYYLKEIKKRKIPLLLISGVYEKNKIFFKWYGSFYREMLQSFSHFFLQNEISGKVLEKLIDKEKITITGDTRCDRVINIAENYEEVPGIALFCGTSKVIVAGSTWEDDEIEWTHFVKTYTEINFIIAPHEVEPERLNELKEEFPNCILYSDWMQTSSQEAETIKRSNCLIIDSIGLLSRLYKYATITYVGGGFGYDGLHNILEAAVYGKPVIFGPEYEKNFEAKEMIECSGGISIENALELEKVVTELLTDDNEIRRRGDAAKNYIYRNSGASEKICSYIEANRLLTN